VGAHVVRSLAHRRAAAQIIGEKYAKRMEELSLAIYTKVPSP